MVGSSPMERSGMSKVSKSLMLNEDLAKLLDDYQTAMGISFTRILTAAIVDFLFEHTSGPNPQWISVAAAMDRGKMAVSDAWKIAVDEAIHNARVAVSHADHRFPKAKNPLKAQSEQRFRDAVAMRTELQKIVDAAATPLDGVSQLITNNPYRSFGDPLRLLLMEESIEADAQE